MKQSLTLFFVLLAHLVSAQNTEIRELCVKALYEAKESMDELISTDPYFQDKLEFGQINEDSLSIIFRYRSKKDEDHAVAPFTQGIMFAFIHPIDRPADGYARTFEWHFLDVKLLWQWSWPHISFDMEHQKKVMLQLRQAVRPLAEYEQGAVRKILSSQGEKGRIVEGKKKVELQLSVRPDSVIAWLDLYAIAQTSGSIFLSNEILYTLIVDDSIHNLNIPYGFIIHLGPGMGKTPFVEVSSQEPAFVRSIPLPRLPPGSHTIRLLTSFNTNSWMDYGPTLVDGQPIRRTLKKAWVGRIFSNRIQVEVGENGLIGY